MATTTEQSGKNIFESWADAQKKAFESFTENTEKFQKDMMNGKATEATADYFKKWYDSQMSFFYNANTNQEQKNNEPMNWVNNWMSQQMESAKKVYEMNQEFTKNFFGNTNWASMPGAGADMKANWDNIMNTYNGWMKNMNDGYADMMKNFSNAQTKDYFSGMFNNADNYMKAFQLWMPFMKSLQDKTFTPDMFRQYFNTAMYKDMMDKMFNFTPDYMKNMYGDMNTTARENMNKMMDAGKNWYESMRNMAATNMPGFMQDPFNSFLNGYQTMYNNLQTAANPFAKMMTPGMGAEQMQTMAELGNKLTVFQVKNSQMQYLVYNAGIKAMEKLSASLYDKVQKGEEIKSFNQVYSEYLNTMDKSFVELFETEEYSKLQSELSAMGLRLKKEVENQMEKAFASLPLVPRSEMDELYKTIYELNKKVKALEKQVSAVAEEEKEESKPVARKASKNA